MTLSIPPELEEFVEREISSGKFRSREEVLAEGLRLLKEREQKLDRLREEIQVGLDQLERGEGTVIEDEESHQSFFNDLERRGLERLAAKKNR